MSTTGGIEPHWAPDGSALYFLGTDSMMKAVVEQDENFRFRTPEALFPTGKYIVADQAPGRFTLSAEGERVMLMRLTAGATENVKLTIVQNWTEELERLVPVD